MGRARTADLIPAGRRESGCAGGTALGAGRMEEVQHAADYPISRGDPKGKCGQDGSQQHGRKQECGHIVFNVMRGNSSPACRCSPDIFHRRRRAALESTPQTARLF